jgi:hypothetical protein
MGNRTMKRLMPIRKCFRTVLRRHFEVVAELIQSAPDHGTMQQWSNTVRKQLKAPSRHTILRARRGEQVHLRSLALLKIAVRKVSPA